jgi:ankyrin repeat protein
MLKYNEYITEAKKSTEDPFIQAAKRGSNEKIKQFIKSGDVDINKQSKFDKRTALMWASLNSFLLVVDTLLKAGADPNIADKDNRSPLMAASTPKIIDKLLEYNADVNIKNFMNGDTAIMEYLDYNVAGDLMISLLNKFLDKGLNLDIKNKKKENFYEKLKRKMEMNNNVEFQKVEDFMNEKFPQYKDEWDLEHDIIKFNL